MNHECRCEAGHYFLPRSDERIDSHMRCPAPVWDRPDRPAAFIDAPFDNPEVVECGEPIDHVLVDIFDYEALAGGV